MPNETSKSRGRRLCEGVFDRYLTPSDGGIDIGCGSDPVTPDCLRWDLPQGDAQELPGIELESLSWVYSSHCLEHVRDPRAAIVRWWEVLRPGGYLYVVVPDEDLYEQGQWPSVYNTDHKHTFTAHKDGGSWSLASVNLADLLPLLPGHRLVWLRTCDYGYDHAPGVWDRTRKGGEAQIELLVQKVESPR